MKSTLRRYFFRWISIQTVLVFLVINVVLLLFNLKEQREHPDLLAEEVEELGIVLGVMALLLPISLLSAWYVSDRLIQPLRVLADDADRVRSGDLEDRLTEPPIRDEFGRLAGALNAAFDRYRHVMHRLERFGYDASHQLRNPLASLQIEGQSCLRQPREPRAYQETIGRMLEDAQRLQRIVEQMLRLARTAGMDLTAQGAPVDLIAVLEDVAADARVAGEPRGVDVRWNPPNARAMVRGSSELISEALANVLDNAVRFSPASTAIDLTLAAGSARVWRIEVSDRGPGVPAALRASLFQPFQRGSHDQGGQTGLGLAIVADVCRAHRGQAGVQDRPGGGAIFWLEWPAL